MIHMSRPAAGNHSKELLTYPPLKSAKGGFTEGKIIIPQDTGACMGAGGRTSLVWLHSLKNQHGG